MPASFGLAFLAGLLSVLSPCVLPLLPLVLGTAASEHRLGPAALAAGLALSFVTIGLFVATIGFAVGLDTALFRTVAAVLLVGLGGVLLVPAAQERFATAAGPAVNVVICAACAAGLALGGFFPNANPLSNPYVSEVKSFRDDKLNGLLEGIASETDPEKRLALAEDVQRYVVDQAYAIPIFEEPQVYGAAPYVKGLAFEAVGRPSFYGVWLDK